jgi:SAM-dependent methyltransferase
MTEPLRFDFNRCAPEGVLGWAVHPAGLRAIHISVDDHHVGDATLGLARPDVAAAFHNAPHTATAGFSFAFPANVLDPVRAAAKVRIEFEAHDGTCRVAERTFPKRLDAPFPPLHLANRVGCLGTQEDPLAAYESMGAGCKASLLRILPKDWVWSGKRVLDMGCGAGRLLRHFVPEARQAVGFFGCDIDAESVTWLTRHLSPPFVVERNEEAPPLPWGDSSFDLIYAISVFTHISDHWTDWLLEVHRLLAPRGLAIITFNGKGFYHLLANEPWDETRVGMNTICHGNSWTLGGPMVFHAPWWIREHWGRLFDVLDLREEGFGGLVDGPSGQGVVLLRRKPTRVSKEELLRIADGDSRELRAIQHNLDQLRRESIQLRNQLEDITPTHHDLRIAREAAEAELTHARAERDYMQGSVSWRVTSPLRWLRRFGRRGSEPS